MAITASSFASGVAQVDGRIWITETHTDTITGALTFAYLAPDTNNATSVMNARVAGINLVLRNTEAARLIDTVAAFALQQNTAAQFAAYLRQRYLASTQTETARLAKWILDGIDNGWFTALQVQNAFGLTAGQWTTLQAKMTNLRTAYNAALAAQGE